MSNLTDATDAALSAERASVGAQLEADTETIRLLQGQHDSDGQTIGELRTQVNQAEDLIEQLQARIAELEGGGDPPPPPPPAPPLMGVSDSKDSNGNPIPAGALDTADLVRCYKGSGSVDGAMARQPKLVALSDEGGTSTAAQLDAMLTRVTAAHPGLLVDWMHLNEVTVDAQNWSAAQLASHIQTVHDHRTVTDEHPDARNCIDLTAYEVRQGGADKLKPCADALQVVYSSCYNPGRKKNPPVWDDYPDYVDPILDLVADWGVPAFGVGEFGNPTDPRDDFKRSAYAVGFLQYVFDGCQARGLAFVGAAWWNQQKSGGPNNRLSTDGFKTATAWKGWTPQ